MQARALVDVFKRSGQKNGFRHNSRSRCHTHRLLQIRPIIAYLQYIHTWGQLGAWILIEY